MHLKNKKAISLFMVLAVIASSTSFPSFAMKEDNTSNSEDSTLEHSNLDKGKEKEKEENCENSELNPETQATTSTQNSTKRSHEERNGSQEENFSLSKRHENLNEKQNQENKEVLPTGSCFTENDIEYMVVNDKYEVCVKKSHSTASKIDVLERVWNSKNNTLYNVTSIGDESFKNCEKLVEINIPSSIIDIGNQAFFNCIFLRKINLQNNLKTINEGAFEKCKFLTEITIPNSVTYIGGQTFKECENLTHIKLPNSIKRIGNDAFSKCLKLKSIKLPNGIPAIGRNFFNSCEKLKKIEIPDGVTSIGVNAFANCENLTQVYMPDSITYIADQSPFYRCKKLCIAISPKIRLNENVFFDCYYVDLNSNLVLTQEKVQKIISTKPESTDKFYVPCGIKKIADGAFENLKIKRVKIPDSVSEIGENAFINCKCLEKVSIPEGVKKIGAHAFDGSGIKKLIIKKGVEFIDSFAFCNCSSLEAINENNILPESIIKIKDGAFANIPKINELKIFGEETKISQCAFIQSDNRKDPLTIRILSNTIWTVEEGLKDLVDSQAKEIKSSDDFTKTIDKSGVLDCHANESLINKEIIEYLKNCGVIVEIIHSDITDTSDNAPIASTSTAT